MAIYGAIIQDIRAIIIIHTNLDHDFISLDEDVLCRVDEVFMWHHQLHRCHSMSFQPSISG